MGLWAFTKLPRDSDPQAEPLVRPVLQRKEMRPQRAYGLAKGRGGQGQGWASSTSSQLLPQLCQVLEKWEGSRQAQ